MSNGGKKGEQSEDQTGLKWRPKPFRTQDQTEPNTKGYIFIVTFSLKIRCSCFGPTERRFSGLYVETSFAFSKINMASKLRTL